MRKPLLAVGILGLPLVLGGCMGPHHGGMRGGADAPHHDDAMHEGHGPHGIHGMGMHGAGMYSADYDAAGDREAAAAVLRAYSDAINAESIEGMEALVIADERFSVIEGRGTDAGWANYRDHHLGPEFASERIDFHSYAYDDIEVRIGHIFAYATFTYAFEATLDGEPYNKEGRGTAVLQRTPEGWRIRHLQTS